MKKIVVYHMQDVARLAELASAVLEEKNYYIRHFTNKQSPTALRPKK